VNAQRRPGLLGLIFGFALLMIRGVLLWVVIPATLVLWLALWPLLRAKKVRLGQLVGWVDLNLIATIEHTILRPLTRTPRSWVALRELPNVTHRVALEDPA
jgi:hypothetical protein